MKRFTFLKSLVSLFIITSLSWIPRIQAQNQDRGPDQSQSQDQANAQDHSQTKNNPGLPQEDPSKNTDPKVEANPCRTQMIKLCPDEIREKSLGPIMMCLSKNDKSIFQTCKQEIQRLVQATRQTTPGGSPLGAIGGMAGLSAHMFSFSYDGRAIQAGNNSPSLTENTLTTSLPVFRNEKNKLAISLMGSELYLSEPILLDSGLEVPTDLKKFDLGLQFSRTIGHRRSLGIRTTFGFAGDEFNHRTDNFMINTNYSFPGESGQWVIMAMMSNNSPLGTFVPIPGFFYAFQKPKFTGIVGLPILSLQWTPIDPWSFSLSLLGPIVKSEASYGDINRLQAFFGLNWRQQKYMLSKRSIKNERLTFEEKDFNLGLRKPFLRVFMSELQGGYVFDRKTYVGKGLYRKTGGFLKMDSEWYLKWSLKFAF